MALDATATAPPRNWAGGRRRFKEWAQLSFPRGMQIELCYSPGLPGGALDSMSVYAEILSGRQIQRASRGGSIAMS
ncbi:hypothetical protein GTV15_06500 [Streptomyces sp. SID7803]|nr:hypothetical protein [Streptomyces sp. SID7803]